MEWMLTCEVGNFADQVVAAKDSMQWTLGAALTRLAEQALSATAIVFVVTRILERLRRKSDEKSKKAERATRLGLFALEAVDLQEKWVQYVRQSIDGEISLSSPYELTTAEQVNELIKAGGDSSLVASIFYVKEGTNDVRRLVIQAQTEIARLATLSPGQLAELKPSQVMVPHNSFRSAVAFVRDRWDRTSKAVDDIVAAAEAHGIDVAPLQKRSSAYCAEYKERRPKLGL